MASPAALAEPADSPRVSYFDDVLPVFQARCQGCHQPAKAQGEFDMTRFARLMAGGESGEVIVPGQPDESYLVELITPEVAADGARLADMPQDGEPLSDDEVALVRRWIAEGAHNDAPPAKPAFTQENPPVYTQPPVITSVDFSPDGKLLAIAGFHEVLLHEVDSPASENASPVSRLVGMSERVQSVAFSPDGKRLAVAAGQPARLGELQVWNLADRALELSLPVTYDTIYGVSWSPDGRRIAFGCADNTLRAVDAETGEQVFFQGSHHDWVEDTVFSVDGSHLVSVGRDRTAKLNHVETERFIDNITSITPGVLKGGISSVARHPEHDMILVGGADSVAKVYVMHRQSKRVIGDDANLARRFPEVPGRIFSVAFANNGTHLAVGASDRGQGNLHVFAATFDPRLPDEIRAIVAKTAQSPAEKQQLEAFYTADVQEILSLTFDAGGVYAVAVSPDSRTVAAAGAEGKVRLIDIATGQVTREFVPIDVERPEAQVTSRWQFAMPDETTQQAVAEAELPPRLQLTVLPNKLALRGRFDKAQLVVSAYTPAGDTLDATRRVRYEIESDQKIAQVTSSGLVVPMANGNGQIKIVSAHETITVPLVVAGVESERPVDFVQDVMPVVARLGCNAGTCHGAKEGKNGFQLSLRGYDPQSDFIALTEELSSRRINKASAADSLMLLKASGAVPHEGGQRVTIDHPYYDLLRRWIAEGAHYDQTSPRVRQLELTPELPVITRIGEGQQMRVVATFADGSRRDVTRETFLEVSNPDIAKSIAHGLIQTLRRGEAAVLARYEGAYAATTLTVMGDRTGFAWRNVAAFNPIDNFVYEKQKRMKILPSKLCTDETFVRRVYLDLTGLPPTAKQVLEFVDDQRGPREKRDALIDRLVGSEIYVDHWTNKWADLLQVNRKYLGAEGAAAYRDWIRNQIQRNTPYDEFVHAVLTASGSNKANPPASYFKILREPVDMMENTTHLFLGVRFNCNKCHDHPFERWTQDQYYQLAAFFAQVGLDKAPEAGDRQVGGTAVEGGKPLYEIISDKTAGEVKHERTGKIAAPSFPYDIAVQRSGEDETLPDRRPSGEQQVSRRAQLARWVTSSDNSYFVESYVNRVWGYLTGVGLMEPLDDIRASNPPTNPELLAWLCDQFRQSDFDVQQLVRTICKSRTYQLSLQTNRWNEDDDVNYSHAIARRLPAEALFDAMHHVTGTTPKIPGVPEGTRAVQLPDAAIKLPDGFLAKFGRPPRESACECERTNDVPMGPVISLVSGATVERVISDPTNALAELVKHESVDANVIRSLYLRILNRSATDREVDLGLQLIEQIPREHEQLVRRLAVLEDEMKPALARLKAKRAVRIAAAKSMLDKYVAAHAEARAEQERERAKRVSALQARLDQYQAALPQQLAAWERQADRQTVWHPLEALELLSTSATTLSQRENNVITATSSNGIGTYTVRCKTDLVGITAVRLEALSGDELPQKGPGRAPDGNFVVSEFQLRVAPESEPENMTEVVLANPQADFSQAGYDVSTAIDGQSPQHGNGWAIAPQTGQDHQASFDTTIPVGFASGSRLTFLIEQNFQSGVHSLGKFRLSVTDSRGPTINGRIPEDIENLLAIAADDRSVEQAAALSAYFRALKPELAQLDRDLEAARQPIVDPQQERLEAALVEAQAPIVIPAALRQLRTDVKLSAAQLETRRLTAVQDLAWALINSPAFLFNR